jgi:hypothetical protein
MLNKQSVSRVTRSSIVILLTLAVSNTTALAQRSRGNVRSSSNQSVHTNANRNNNVNRNANVNRNTNVNQNVNVNRNIDVDRDIDVDHRYGGLGGCCYQPVARAAAATAAAVTTAAIVGSVVHALPASCESVSVNGYTYQQCGSSWYMPQFAGSSVTYVVVNPPR